MNRLFLPLFVAVFFLFSGPASTEAADQKILTGKVVETMNSGGYTYVQLQQAETAVWLALPETTVNKGETASFLPGMEMKDFESKTLSRTFPSIIFSPGRTGAGKPMMNPHTVQAQPTPKNSGFHEALQAEKQKSAATMPIEVQQPSPGSTGAIVPSADVSVPKAEGNNSYSVEECFVKAEELNNTTILIRGKVMKVSPMIMGRNWVHIQDGSGNPMKNTHDLVVTTQDLPKKDTIVTFSGTLSANKDFGAGYKYAAIVEEAKIQ